MRFRVVDPIEHGTTANDIRRYEVGETIDLSAEQAAAIPWAVQALPEAEKTATKPRK
jgi:hypothetical protein